jgi:UDP-2,4-diacetamido-2,4,6-trideoxy-beta-L-altropyranose hydrolase
MNVVIRTDASVWIGSGHVMRCLVLADELKTRGHSIVFVCLPQKGDMITYIQSRGFTVVLLSKPQESTTPNSDSDYLAWLQRPVLEDAEDFIQLIEQVDLVVSDHYAIGFEWQNRIKKHFLCRIIAIDDLVREHDADLIIDQTLGRDESEYNNKTRKLTGCMYAILSPRFAFKRERAFKKEKPSKIPKILLSMGGIDTRNATLLSLKALNSVNAEISVLLSQRAPHYWEVKRWCEKRSKIKHYDFVDDMASFMIDHDIAIGAPGTTSWERACLGLPNVLIQLAANQADICKQLVKYEASVAVLYDNIADHLVTAYENVARNWEAYRASNFRLCDGVGVWRVCQEIEAIMEQNSVDTIELKKATSTDIKEVYRWQCHPKTRQYSLCKEKPTWHEHSKWMLTKLENYKDFFYIIKNVVSKQSLGVLRLDSLESNSYLVSIYIEPTSYGQGVASAALSMADSIHPYATLYATVLADNKSSQKLFEKANYQRVSNEKFIRQPIL